MIERKWLITIVVISIALNLLLVGFYIGQQPLPGRTNLSIDPTMVCHACCRAYLRIVAVHCSRMLT